MRIGTLKTPNLTQTKLVPDQHRGQPHLQQSFEPTSDESQYANSKEGEIEGMTVFQQNVQSCTKSETEMVMEIQHTYEEQQSNVDDMIRQVALLTAMMKEIQENKAKSEVNRGAEMEEGVRKAEEEKLANAEEESEALLEEAEAAEIESDEEQEDDAMETSESEGVYKKLRVTIDYKLLEAMVYFKDPIKRKNCAGRGQKGKKAKSGKRVHLSSLKELGVEEQFFSYIKAAGFEWLLEHSLVEVPVDLEREFFTSFYFTRTTDLDAPSIRFRVFNQEMLMTLREWSLCLGLLTPEEDEAGEWADKEVGQPEDTDGFDAQAAWELITTEEAAPFRTSVSKGTDIINPALRLAQVFLACNLLGQANGTITTPELYFMWCMLTDVKVHLGYWIAQAIHKITRRPVRHLYACHLLGAYLQRNVIMTMARPRPIITMCDSPQVGS